MTPSTIYLFHNGQIMAFDSLGHQMPQWQGKFEEIIPKLLKVKWSGKIEMRGWREQ